MANKYIQNTYSADIQIVLKKDGRFERNVVFAHYVFNRVTGQVENDGYTEVDEELYERLKKDACFNVLVSKGKLVVKDEAPLKAGSFTQLMEMKARIKELEDENKKLKAENEELKKGVKKGGKSGKGGKPDTEEAAEATEGADE
jgi:hypothetical protein